MHNKNLILVFGCQRSGTTAAIDGLKRVAGCRVFDEENDLTNRCHDRFDAGMPLRLKPWPQVLDVINGCQEPTIVLKPLVESQNARQLLEFFPGSVGLWMFRGYRDVVSSMLAKWGDKVGRTPLLSIIQGRRGDWRSENIDSQTREFVSALEEQCQLTPADSAALFWYLRNKLLFQQKLEHHDAVRTVQYEYLVSHGTVLSDLVRDLGIHLEFPSNVFHAESLSKGSEIELNPIVQQICDDLSARLVEHFQTHLSRQPVRR